MKQVTVNGVRIYPFESRDELLNFMDENKGILVAVNAEKILNATDATRKIINNNIGYADGEGAVLALKQQGAKSIKTPGCELWLDIISKYKDKKNFYFVGGKQQVIEEVVLKLDREFPDLNIVNYRNGYVKSDGEKMELINDIADKRPDVVFVAMGSPRQELLMQEMQKVHNAIYQGLGGSFDVYTGKVKRAPRFWVKLKLEWFYRWVNEPTLRTKRNLKLIKFYVLLKLNRFK